MYIYAYNVQICKELAYTACRYAFKVKKKKIRPRWMDDGDISVPSHVQTSGDGLKIDITEKALKSSR